MKYFTNVKTLDELKKEYRRLSKIHHPDCGGDEETMKAINNEHDELFEILKRQHNARADADPTGKTRRTTETAQEFRTVIEALLKLDLTVELCGSWLWISGDTKPHKEDLKKVGCRWSASKKMWYWRHPEDGYTRSRGKATMNQIRNRYGSQTFQGSRENYEYPATV